jgi:hypothetical protein
MTDDTTRRATASDDASSENRPTRGGRGGNRPTRDGRDGTRPTRGTRGDARPTRGTRGNNRPTRGAGGDARDASGDRTADDSPTEADDPVEGSDADTNSAEARFWLTNDVLAFLLVSSFVGVFVGAGMGLLDLTAVPVEMRLAYLTVSGGSAVWTFGQPAYRTWAEARRGGGTTARSGHCCCCSKRR